MRGGSCPFGSGLTARRSFGLRFGSLCRRDVDGADLDFKLGGTVLDLEGHEEVADNAQRSGQYLRKFFVVFNHQKPHDASSYGVRAASAANGHAD